MKEGTVFVYSEFGKCFMEPKKILKIGLGLAILAALFYFADLSKIVENIGKAYLRLYLLGFGLYLTTYIGAALRWKNLSRNIGFDLSLIESFRLIAISYSFNKLFPGNSGDVLRSKIFERYRQIDSHGNILGIAALERFLDVISVVSVVGFALAFVASSFFSQVKWILVPFVAGSFLAGLLLFLNTKYLEKIFSYAPSKFEGFLNEIMEGYQSCSKKDLFLNFVYSIYIWAVEAAVFYIFILALGIDLGFWDGALVNAVMSMVSALPISPGGLGPVDATGAGLLVIAGVTYSKALSLVILQRSLGFLLLGAVGGIVYAAEELFRNHREDSLF